MDKEKELSKAEKAEKKNVEAKNTEIIPSKSNEVADDKVSVKEVKAAHDKSPVKEEKAAEAVSSADDIIPVKADKADDSKANVKKTTPKKTKSTAKETKTAKTTKAADKTTAKKTSKAKSTTKKETTKTTAKKATTKASIKTYIQYLGREIDQEELVARVKENWIAQGNSEKDIKDLKLYVKPEEGAVYYVVNDIPNSGKIDF